MKLREMAHQYWRKGLPALSALTYRFAPWQARRLVAPPVSAYCVARMRNADVVRAFIEKLPPGSTAHVHQLDGEHPGRMAGLVRSSGAGMRMPLLNALMAAHPPRRDHWVMIFDDDVRWVAGAASALLAVAQAGALDIAQPVHAPGSQSTFLVTRYESASLARLSRFVEVGPVVVFSPDAQRVALPFPNEASMGWGVDVYWTTLGLRLGVVDAAPIHHLGPVGADYSNAAEEAFAAPMLAKARVTSAHDLDSPVGITWRPWQERPRWLRDPQG